MKASRKVVLDTNVFYSIIFRPSDNMNFLLFKILKEHELFVPDVIFNEILNIANRKNDNGVCKVREFFRLIPHKRLEKINDVAPEMFWIRDPNDYLVLYASIVANADVFVTGDKDFLEVEIEKPEILTPREFLFKY